MYLRPHSLSALLVFHLLNLVGFLVQGTFLQIKSQVMMVSNGTIWPSIGLLISITTSLYFCGH